MSTVFDNRRIVLRSAIILATAVGLPLLLNSPARANGPCGQNFDGEHACAVNSPYSASGSLVTSNDHDYYVFYASKGTELSVTLRDATNPETCPADETCGNVDVELANSVGNEVGDNYASSDINNGIVVPGTFNYTIEESGTYYLIVHGNEEPYILTVAASPNVVWPAPPPPPPPPAPPPPEPQPPPACVVPALHHDETLARAEDDLVAANCTVGRVTHEHAPHVHNGYVMALNPHSGTHLAHDASVTVTVSSGPAPPPLRRHKHHRRRRRRRR